jgi:hypothetical protein
MLSRHERNMEAIIVICPMSYDSKFDERLNQFGPIQTGEGGVRVVTDGELRVYMYRNDSVSEELDPEHMVRIRSMIPAPVFYSVDFSDIAFCRRVLTVIADDASLLVDNDHGVLLTGQEFVRVLRSQPNWDWRLDHA